MSWIALLKGILGIASSLTAYINNKQLMDAGEAKAIARQLESSINVLDKAQKARRAAVADFDARDGVPDEQDPNLRD